VLEYERAVFFFHGWHHLAGISFAVFLAFVATTRQAQEQKFKVVSVKTSDGLTISAQDWGNPNGPEILFIHGFSQSHRSWIKQVTSSELAKKFHMVTYDLRGHGNSDKPLEPERGPRRTKVGHDAQPSSQVVPGELRKNGSALTKSASGRASPDPVHASAFPHAWGPQIPRL
jgi:pimeloyl-ACP methyl ester carboxylesterase